MGVWVYGCMGVWVRVRVCIRVCGRVVVRVMTRGMLARARDVWSHPVCVYMGEYLGGVHVAEGEI